MVFIRFLCALCLFLTAVSFEAWADDEIKKETKLDENHEAEIAQKAKKRLYPGGRDEEDLKVQSQVSAPSRKLSPQAEVKEDSVEE